MTDTQFTAILGFAGTIATLIFTHLKTEQSLKSRALELKEETQKAATLVANTTRATAEIVLKQAEAAHMDLKADMRENTNLTIVGNDIKSDIVRNQVAITELQDSKVDKTT